MNVQFHGEDIASAVKHTLRYLTASFNFYVNLVVVSY